VAAADCADKGIGDFYSTEGGKYDPEATMVTVELFPEVPEVPN
jgi:hypothetical protein